MGITTRLSSKGQVVTPRAIRNLHHWRPGQELMVIDKGDDGVLLKPKRPYQTTCLDDVAGCLAYGGRAKTLDDMERAIDAVLGNSPCG